jgi:hypothetical protein
MLAFTLMMVSLIVILFLVVALMSDPFKRKKNRKPSSLAAAAAYTSTREGTGDGDLDVEFLDLCLRRGGLYRLWLWGPKVHRQRLRKAVKHLREQKKLMAYKERADRLLATKY